MKIWEKRNILSSFNDPLLVPNLYSICCWTQKEDILKNAGNQTVAKAIDFHNIFSHPMEVNGYYQLLKIFQNIYVGVQKKKETQLEDE